MHPFNNLYHLRRNYKNGSAMFNVRFDIKTFIQIRQYKINILFFSIYDNVTTSRNDNDDNLRKHTKNG